MLPGEFLLFCFFQKLWVFYWRERIFYQLSKFNSDSKINHTVIKISWHLFLEKGVKKAYDIDRVLTLKFDRKRTWLVNLGTLGIEHYIRKTWSF